MINRQKVLRLASMYIPSENELDEADLELLLDNVIEFRVTADEEGNEPEAACKFLKAIGEANLSRQTTFTRGLKRDKAYEGELEYFDSDRPIRAWKAFIESLSDICPSFGYVPEGSRRAYGIAITPGEKPNINPYCKPFRISSGHKLSRPNNYTKRGTF